MPPGGATLPGFLGYRFESPVVQVDVTKPKVIDPDIKLIFIRLQAYYVACHGSAPRSLCIRSCPPI